MTTPPNPPTDQPDSTLAQWMREHRAPGEPSFDVDAGWSRFSARPAKRPAVGLPRRAGWRPSVVAAAASATVAAMAAAAVFVLAEGRIHARIDAGSPPMSRRVAAAGSREVVTLEDGTRITLNGGSALSYPARRGDRDVYLTGEALFEITHDPGRRFRVHAASGVVEDIGTKFIVRAYPTDRSVQVAVTEGRVTFGRDSAGLPSVDLAAGGAAAIDSAGHLVTLPAGSLDRFVGWTTGALVFDSIALRDAAADIERRYGVRVMIADSALAKRPVIARFHGEPVAQVLDAITVALGARYDVQGITFTIRAAARP